MAFVMPRGRCKNCGTKVKERSLYCDDHRPPSKYRSVRTEWRGVCFDSAKEAARYAYLAGLESGGAIANLRRQVRYPLAVNGVKVCDYVADCVYEVDGATVVEDVKGVRTAVYNLKAKLFRAVYGFSITEV